MSEVVLSWLDVAARIKAEHGTPLFVVISYTFTALFAISQVRAVRLDRQFAGKRALTRMQTRALAFVIGLPCQLMIGYLWGYGFVVSLGHAVLAGALAPVAADAWISLLYWRGCREQAAIFKVARKRRASDLGDDTGDFTRL